MTSYANEEDFLRDQIQSNNLAIKFIKRELNRVRSEIQDDYIDTKSKVINVYAKGVEALEEDSEQKRERIKFLGHDDEGLIDEY
jgi:hypothetical protein|tara:strand:+ start:91 stop:342 length:252 start_codon:yes stop_codon:yes gene_type:complete